MQQEYPVASLPSAEGKIQNKSTKRSRRLIIGGCTAIAVAAIILAVLYLPKLVKEDKEKTSGRDVQLPRSNGSPIQNTPSSTQLGRPSSGSSVVSESTALRGTDSLDVTRIISSSTRNMIASSVTSTGEARPTASEALNPGYKWSRWSPWNDCSSTCGGGQQVRSRTCNVFPGVGTPLGSCVGTPKQTKACADWGCPDCNKTCKVGTLNAACDACECAHHILTGRILTAEGRALSKANISLAETPYNVISQSNVSGHFQALGVCATSQLFLVVKDKFVPVKVVSEIQSGTQSKLDAKLENAVSPYVLLHPENKIRLSGQSVVFCCDVRGNPTPEVEWFKNGNILNRDRFSYNSTLYIRNVSGMKGDYRCRAVNEFGSEYSKPVALKVLEPVKDSCNSTPSVHKMTLPFGCVHKETNSTVVDIGYCADSRCIRNDTDFTSDACSDRRYCCGSQKISDIPVLCAGSISFNLQKINECGCAECRVKMAIVQGIAVGGANDAPMKYGNVIVEGLDDTVTDDKGRFSVEVPKGMSRVVMTFEDTIFQKLESTTKVFHVNTKQSSFYKVYLPEKAPVMEFDGSHLKTIALGQAKMTPFADVEIAEDSFLSKNGSQYRGPVKAMVGFTDPRNALDILMAPGDFSALDENGEEQLLISYGMLKLNFEDSEGKRLDVAKPIKVYLDPEQINVTNSDGNTTAKLWWLNKKTGRWIQAGNLYSVDRNNGKRRKRSNRRFLLAELSEAVAQDTEYNIDYPDVYNYVAVEAPVNTIVTMVGKTEGSSQFFGYRQKSVTRQNTRRVCIPTYTNGEALLLAENDGEPLEPLPNASFPSEVGAIIVSQDAISGRPLKVFQYIAKISGSNGPIYAPKNFRIPRPCQESINNFAFQFNRTNEAQPTFQISTIRINQVNNPRHWYGLTPFNENAERCYVKVKVKGSRSVIMVKSSTKYLKGPNTVDVDYGYSAAITEIIPTSNREQFSVVCLEYRCNGLLTDTTITPPYTSYTQQTLVTVVPLTSTCTFKSLNNLLNATQSSCALSFPPPTSQEKTFCVPTGIVGERIGLYRGSDGLVKSRCYEGNNDLGPPPSNQREAGGHTLTFECQ